MRPRFVINKGISKKVTAVSSHFTIGDTYVAAIYNRHDLSLKITAYGTCEANETNNRPQVVFVWPKEETDKLKVGYATIEIYDIAKTMMIYREEFAVIRKNSLPLTDYNYES